MAEWAGTPPKRCQMCLSPITTNFVDGKTVQGAWVIMCVKCHRVYGVGLGTGKGQLYRRDRCRNIRGKGYTSKTFVKVDG